MTTTTSKIEVPFSQVLLDSWHVLCTIYNGASYKLTTSGCGGNGSDNPKFVTRYFVDLTQPYAPVGKTRQVYPA